ETARQPDRGGQLGGGPEPVRHDVGDGPYRPAALVPGDTDVLPGYLRDRVDLILRAPAHADHAALDLAGPFAARPPLGGEEIRGMGEFHDVQAARVQVPSHRGQVTHHVVQGEQVAQRVQHRDGQVVAARAAEIPHVGLDHGQLEARLVRQL